ncbi:hypothetical protein QI292_03740 [Staphylococcus saprophyticus]|nr:hypothetical protein [Staphylococcus saprophyticus]
MRKQFKPVIKHDVVTQTYTIRDKKGVVIQVTDVIIDELDNYYKAQRDTLIDDLSWYKAKVSRLERELKKKNMDADRLGYRWRNSHDEAKTYKSLLSEFSQHIGNKPSSSTYKYFRAKLDGIGIKEGE